MGNLVSLVSCPALCGSSVKTWALLWFRSDCPWLGKCRGIRCLQLQFWFLLWPLVFPNVHWLPLFGSLEEDLPLWSIEGSAIWFSGGQSLVLHYWELQCKQVYLLWVIRSPWGNRAFCVCIWDQGYLQGNVNWISFWRYKDVSKNGLIQEGCLLIYVCCISLRGLRVSGVYRLVGFP